MSQVYDYSALGRASRRRLEARGRRRAVELGGTSGDGEPGDNLDVSYGGSGGSGSRADDAVVNHHLGEITRLLAKNHNVHVNAAGLPPHKVIEHLHNVLFHLDRGGKGKFNRPESDFERKRPTTPEGAQENFSDDYVERAANEMGLELSLAAEAGRTREGRSTLSHVRQRLARLNAGR